MEGATAPGSRSAALAGSRKCNVDISYHTNALNRADAPRWRAMRRVAARCANFVTKHQDRSALSWC